jgi:hypothetical protein
MRPIFKTSLDRIFSQLYFTYDIFIDFLIENENDSKIHSQRMDNVLLITLYLVCRRGFSGHAGFVSFVYICIAIGDPIIKRRGLGSHS